MSGSTPSRWSCVPFTELSAAQLDGWRDLRASDPQLASPYHHPGFTAVAAAVDPDVRVVLGTDARGELRLVLPLRVTGHRAVAAGYPAADFQGPVCAPSTEWDVRAMMRAGGLTYLHLDHLRAGVVGVDTLAEPPRSSPYVDVSGGLDAYLARATKSGRSQLAEARRHERHAERDHGSYRYVADSDDPALLDRIIELKRRQYQATGARDYFATGRHRRLIVELLERRDPDFGGLLSAVWAGPHLLAGHFGIRSGPVLHWWFPTYDPQFSRLGPGWLLLRSTIAAAPELGLERLDLGRGEDDYKRRAMTGATEVRELVVDLNPARRQARRAQAWLRERARSSDRLRELVHRARRRRPI